MSQVISTLRMLWELSQYFWLVIPAGVAMIGFWAIRPVLNERHKVAVYLAGAALALFALGFLIWTNPYGREISSSLGAWGVFPVASAFLVAVLMQARQVAALWSTDRPLLIVLGGLLLVALAFVWFAQDYVLYMILGLSVGVFLMLAVGRGLNLVVLAVLSVLLWVILVVAEGNFFSFPLVENLSWLRTGLNYLGGFSMVAMIFLAAGLVYGALNGENDRGLGSLIWRLGLAAILIGGSAYYQFWEGVWSSAHARAFEDHLPFAHFIFSLIAGMFLAIVLRGWRRLAGPAFAILVTAFVTLIFTLGWNVSAFDLTEHRAEQVNQAIESYYHDYGRYPDSLEALTPNYLLFLPAPVVVHNAGWCYQGGDHFYRLGYVSGEFTYFESDFFAQVFAQTGYLSSEGGWACDELVARFQNKSLLP